MAQTEQEQKEVKEQKDKIIKEARAQNAAISPETKQDFASFWNQQLAVANQNYKEDFEKLIVMDSFNYEGKEYKAHRITFEEKFKLADLQKAARTLGSDRIKYLANMKARAKLLIEGFSDEDFDTGDSYVIELIVTAWGAKPEGFRHIFKGV